MTQIILDNGKLSLGILPQCGGALSFLKYMGTDVLRPAKPDEMEANNSALFPMIPYTSFISDGHFPYFGITRNVPTNSPVSRYPMHGDVWRSKLELVKQSNDSVELKLVHKKSEGFPYDYTAGVVYTLKGQDLLITLKVQNDTALPMPYGLGVHPFFCLNKSTMIQFNAQNVWFRGGDPILGHPYAIPPALDFSKARSLPHTTTDISVDNWDGTAEIITENYTIKMSADETFGHLILHAPRGKDFFCLEPVSHTPDAFNLAAQGIVGTGIQSLGPKQAVSNTITFSLKGK